MERGVLVGDLPPGVAAEYWVPAFAGMTVVVMLGAGFREDPDQQRTVTLRCVQTGTTPAGVASVSQRSPQGEGAVRRVGMTERWYYLTGFPSIRTCRLPLGRARQCCST